MDGLSLALVIIGAVNWLLIGIFQFDAIAAVFGGQSAVISRIVYSLIGLAGLWSVGRMFRRREDVEEAEDIID